MFLKMIVTDNMVFFSLSKRHYMSKCGDKLSDWLYFLLMSHECEDDNSA